MGSIKEKELGVYADRERREWFPVFNQSLTISWVIKSAGITDLAFNDMLIKHQSHLCTCCTTGGQRSGWGNVYLYIQQIESTTWKNTVAEL